MHFVVCNIFGISGNFERFVKRQMLSQFEQPLLWAMDEVDRLFSCDFSNEVFGLFCSWHNARAFESSWQQLTLAIAYATETHLFIRDPNQSPFNVGTRLTLNNFTLEQVVELNQRYSVRHWVHVKLLSFVGWTTLFGTLWF